MKPLKNRGYDTVVLSAGHGGQDSGAISPQGHKEASQTIFITDRVAEYIKKIGFADVIVAPHSLDSAKDWVNNNANVPKEGKTFGVEFHRDSAGVNGLDADTRFGIYYFDEKALGSDFSKVYATKLEVLADKLTKNTKSWARPDSAVRFGRLEWNRDTDPFTLLFECGFVQGRNDDEHLTWLAKVSTALIYLAFTGEELDLNKLSGKPAPTIIDIPNNNNMSQLETIDKGISLAEQKTGNNYEWIKKIFRGGNVEMIANFLYDNYYKRAKQFENIKFGIEDAIKATNRETDLKWVISRLLDGKQSDIKDFFTIDYIGTYARAEKAEQELANCKITLETYSNSIDNKGLELSNQVEVLEAKIEVLQETNSLLLSNDTNWTAQINILKKDLESVKLEKEKLESQVFASGQVPNATADLVAKIDSDSKNGLVKIINLLKGLPIITSFGGGVLTILLTTLQTQIVDSNFSIASAVLTFFGMALALILPNKK